MNVDLRSDTITRPTPGMLEAMFSAPVGDDVFGEDPSVNELEQKLAGIFGKDEGVFCPSGTMTNQIALQVLTRPRDEVICDHTSHVYLYEGGGLAYNSGLSVCLVPGDRGRITAEQVKSAIKADNIHYPHSSVVSLENTHNRGGGSIYSLDVIREIKSVCDRNKLKLHLDGARIFNALAEAPYNAADIGKYFDTISVCLSKGLGTPVGSVLLGSASLMHEARRVRKVFGGGMRQSGFLAAAGIYALDHHLERLHDDHARAKILEKTLNSCSFINEVIPVQTNIVVARLDNKMPVATFLSSMEENNIKVVQFGDQAVRMVTHLDFNDAMLDYTCSILSKLN